jgi:hypothetical protein
MRWKHGLGTAAALAALLGAGCTSLREIPRSQYAEVPQHKHVRLVTQDGLTYEFDFVSVAGDTLTGFRQQDVSGPAEQYATVEVPLAEVTKLSIRSLDWYRTGLIGGGVIAALVARGLADSNEEPAEPNGGGGGGGRVP